MKCNNCGHVNEPKNLEFERTITIPDNCEDCFFINDTEEGYSYCLYYEKINEINPDKDAYDKPAWCKLSHVDIWRKNEKTTKIC